MDTSPEFQLMLKEAIREYPKDFDGFDRTKNVQDQLQDMLGYQSMPILIGDIWQRLPLVQLVNEEKQGIFRSMEQLLLAFVVHELRSKIWDGETWRKGEA